MNGQLVNGSTCYGAASVHRILVHFSWTRRFDVFQKGIGPESRRPSILKELERIDCGEGGREFGIDGDRFGDDCEIGEGTGNGECFGVSVNGANKHQNIHGIEGNDVEQ